MLDEDGRHYDHASPDLKRIRQKQHAVRDSIKRRFPAALPGPRYRLHAPGTGADPAQRPVLRAGAAGRLRGLSGAGDGAIRLGEQRVRGAPGPGAPEQPVGGASGGGAGGGKPHPPGPHGEAPGAGEGSPGDGGRPGASGSVLRPGRTDAPGPVDPAGVDPQEAGGFPAGPASPPGGSGGASGPALRRGVPDAGHHGTQHGGQDGGPEDPGGLRLPGLVGVPRALPGGFPGGGSGGAFRGHRGRAEH